MRSPKILALVIAALAVSAVASAEPTKTERAESHYKQGAAFYQQKLYAQALDEYAAAYDLDPKPLLHYHMARAQQGEGHRETALAMYRTYLDEEPKGKAADDARKQVVLLTKDLVDHPPVVDKPEPPPVDKPVDKPLPPPIDKPIDKPVDKPPVVAPRTEPNQIVVTPPPAPTHHTDWRFVGAGAALVVVGVLVDTLPGTASNHKLDALDFAPLACYAGGATLAYVGVF